MTEVYVPAFLMAVTCGQHDGWKAVAYHERHSPYEDDVWELYHLEEDSSDCHDLAQAERYGVFPLDDRNFAERVAKYYSPVSPRRVRSYRLYRGMSLVAVPQLGHAALWCCRLRELSRGSADVVGPCRQTQGNQPVSARPRDGIRHVVG